MLHLFQVSHGVLLSIISAPAFRFLPSVALQIPFRTENMSINKTTYKLSCLHYAVSEIIGILAYGKEFRALR